MRQVVFRLPIPGLYPEGVPIYGYGLMLFIAFIVCTWLAGRRAQKEGIAREHIQDLAIWLFIGGLVMARVVYLINEINNGRITSVGDFLWQFPRIWDGGVILYGAVIGGLLGYLLGYFFIVRKHHLSSWKIADLAAPSIALGLCLGRVGCLLNGCCYGHVACPDCPGVSFPLSAPARFPLVAEGYQSAAGFVLVSAADDPRTVASVDPTSSAGRAGLRPGDVIVLANDQPIKHPDELRERVRGLEAGQELTLTVERDGRREVLEPMLRPTLADFQTIDSRVVKAVMPGSAAAQAGLEKWDRIIKVRIRRDLIHHDDHNVDDASDLSRYLDAHQWPRGESTLTLTVVKPDNREQVLSFEPRTLPLYPTQVFESVSMFLLFLLLTAFYPLRRHDGEVIALLMVGYAIHRYLNEMLRNDVRPEGFEKYASILLFVAGLVIFVWLRRKPAQYPARAKV
ncbi:MAG TPA: prolipoprotein diacylglyceryl transferase family protein [Gemmataceae bacterium]|jgi:prolipoprotein diacylglyceryltransferase|nr:prolipoprotein diacylglyceryl transferase family protein [Gemmataceae bacterium]